MILTILYTFLLILSIALSLFFYSKYRKLRKDKLNTQSHQAFRQAGDISNTISHTPLQSSDNKVRPEIEINEPWKEYLKLSKILDQIPAFVCLQDQEHYLNYANRTFIDLFGVPLNQTCYQLLRKRDIKCENCPTYDNCEGLLDHGCEWTDGTGNTYIVFDNSYIDIDGKRMILKVGMDISERKKVEDDLKQSEEKLRLILDGFDDPIYISNPDYTLFYANKAMEKMIGEDTIGTKCCKTIYGKETVCEWCIYENLIDRGGILDYDIQIPGTEMYRNIRNILLPENRKLTIYHDITNRKQSEKKLTELNATKDKLFSIIAHDLRSPFSSILGFSELLIKNTDPGKTKQFSEMIHLSAKGAFELLETLLTWARLQSGTITSQPEHLQLYPLVKGILDLLRNQAELKSITLVNDITQDISVYSDSNMINTVIRNLLTNAIKYTGTNGEVAISGKRMQDFIEITVSDNGIGISQEDLDKLFKIEHKVSSPGTNNEQGTGLGLILCKEFVEQNKGKIWVESELGKGSRFRFTLPVTQQ
jgi:signal transduction histidine kinase